MGFSKSSTSNRSNTYHNGAPVGGLSHCVWFPTNPPLFSGENEALCVQKSIDASEASPDIGFVQLEGKLADSGISSTYIWPILWHINIRLLSKNMNEGAHDLNIFLSISFK